MSNDKWFFLEAALGRLADFFRPVNLSTLLIDRLESAVASADRSRIETARDRISAFARKARQPLSDEALRQLRDTEKLGELAYLYEMGQIDFAEHFATRVAQRRVPDAFMHALTAKKFEPLLQRLFLKELANVELAAELNRSEETVGRSLGELRELGIVDCRREGRKLINFLTPQARAAFSTVTVLPAPRETVRAAVRKRIEEATQELEPHLRTNVVFEEADEISSLVP